jgi:Uncharacterized protein conserved in bacteria (DUF2272)
VIDDLKRPLILLTGLAALIGAARAEPLYFERLPGDILPVKSPAQRVGGAPGEMRVLETSCQSEPLAGARQRIVDIAVQEWAYFGFSVADETAEPEPRAGGFSDRPRRFPRGFSWLGVEESARLAGSIAGYWAITGDGSWILSRQNEVWNGDGVGARWRDPWSAAFVSWVMCESGLGDDSRFVRAINHHTYIDQAIRARDDAAPETAYVAYDIGEAKIEPGDLLCAARRPTYDTIEERRRQLGDGIRSHCDIVVKLEPESQRVLAIGGNVRGSVSLKLLPAEFVLASGPGGDVRSVGRGRGHVFAHLKLRDAPVDGDAFLLTPTLKSLGAQPDLIGTLKTSLEQAVKTLGDSLL